MNSPRICRPIRISTILFSLLGVGLLILFTIRAWNAGHNDFIAYFNAGVRAAHGESPYALEETPYRYLPLTAFFFSPLALFPLRVARVVFLAANFIAVLLIYREIGKRVGALALGLLLILFFRFHNHDFQNAQVNPILLILFFAWWKYRRSHLPAAAFAFSLFASFKLVPFAFGLPLLLLGKKKELAWMAFWTLTLNLLPVLFYDHGFLIFRDWYDQAKLIAYPAVMLSNIQSLQSALWWGIEGHLDAHLFATLTHVLQLVLLLAVVACAPRKDGTEHGLQRREDWVIASTLAVTVLIAPMAWKHNYLQFLPLAYLWFREDPGFVRSGTRKLYATALLGMVLIPSLVSNWNRGFSDRMYLMVWTGLVVIFMGLANARRNAQMFPIEK
ncbi:MAG: DUF2029 domain-containing protein [Cryobacterium sp.]|nr:DUF2029 domain-containing protein [Oligoflexia bacterium]